MAARQANTQSTKTDDTQKMNLELTKQVNGLEEKKKTIAQRYREEPKVAVQGSPMYRPYFGNNMPIIINGVAVYVPLDGQQYQIPESFAAVFSERISRIDEQIRIRNQMADVSNNVEKYAGEKTLISKG